MPLDLTPLNEDSETLTASSEGSEPLTALSELDQVLGLYPSSTTFPGSSTYPQTPYGLSLTVLSED